MTVTSDTEKDEMAFDTIYTLYQSLYKNHVYVHLAYEKLLFTIAQNRNSRSKPLKDLDLEKQHQATTWYTSSELVGMSLYIDRFAGSMQAMHEKLDYLHVLGVNLVHYMPLFQSPEGENDGGYAVSDFRTVDAKFGTNQELNDLIQEMHHRKMYVMLDIVLNHCSHIHDWAMRAKAGDPYYQDYFYMYDNRDIPNQFEQSMPEIFPESAPGNFTYIEECQKWVMTVFHHYQWDLNYSNPLVLVEMVDLILYYANLGIDILRIDAPAFIWKKLGTNCQNLDEAHTILRIIKQVVSIAAPGMALLGEAIVAPQEIIKYFGTGTFEAKECEFAYNATMMALQWDALATGKTNIMRLAAQSVISKPKNTSWISYTRCHDDIGLGYSDEVIAQSGFEPIIHRRFLHTYYAGVYPGSTAKGALFSVNPKTQDARISGSLASLCGLEYAIQKNDAPLIQQAVDKILLMQAQSFFYGGLPMLFYGDEVGYTNDYSYLQDENKSYDNRWMHRPIIHWEKNENIKNENSIEQKIYSGTQQLLAIRKSTPIFSDTNNLSWLTNENNHIVAFVRHSSDENIFCLFNYSPQTVYLSWFQLKSHAQEGDELLNVWNNERTQIGSDQEHFSIKGYGFLVAKTKR